MIAYLIKSGGKQVERRQDAAVWTQTVLFHHILVVYLSMQVCLDVLAWYAASMIEASL